MKSSKFMAISVVSSMMLMGCTAPEPIETWVNHLKNWVGMNAVSPKAEKTLPSSASPSPASDSAALLKANAELMAEMMKVTFMQKEVEDQTLFTSLTSSLVQGASLEGTYRGLVMGSRYRALESNAKAASPNAIKFFATEMASLQVTMKNPTVFTKETAKSIPSIEYPEGDVGDATPSELNFNESPSKKASTQNELVQQFLTDFIGATPYTLKRVLADEALKKIDEMNGSSGELAQWYAGWVVRMVETGVDFGLPQRNSADFDFHFRFAKAMSQDRVKWEVLNRYHRILNHLE